jgi:hypothetical protein
MRYIGHIWHISASSIKLPFFFRKTALQVTFLVKLTCFRKKVFGKIASPAAQERELR